MFDSFRSALKSLWNNKLRSFLTLLGVVIGIYTVVTLLAVAQGLQKQIADQVEELGPRVIFILPGESEEGSSTPNFASAFAPSTIFVEDVTYLRERATLLEDELDYVVMVGGLLSKAGKKVTAFPLGGTLNIPKNNGVKIIEGRDLNAEDITAKRNVIFITQGAANKLDAKLGDTLKLGARDFTLTGIYGTPDNAALSFGDSQNLVIIPATVASEMNQSNQVSRILATAKEADKVSEAKREIITLLKAKHGAEDFTVLLSDDLLSSFTEITDMLKYAVVGIAAISLLVGGIGISNIMLVTVTERTREIGIRKAVGATEGAILLQFLIEAVVLTVIGAAIGLGLAAVTATVAAKVSPLEPSITNETILLALGMGAITGIVFGLFPAFRAARKNPVEALRFE